MLNIISLGAGVQSSWLLLAAERGLIEPRPDYAIFADTQDEPRHSFTTTSDGKIIGGGIYGWLDYLESQTTIPVIRVTRGDLMADSQIVKTSKKTGRKYMKGFIPAFLVKPDGSKVLFGRKCTADYKIDPIQRKIKEVAGIRRGGNEVVAIVWIGISMDEIIRMKPSRVPYLEHRWPLIEKRMTRQDCLNWMSSNGYPIPPRSACVSCPFHNDAEWKNLKEHSPKDFASAVKTERALQDAARNQNAFTGLPYLHSSGLALDQVDFDALNTTNQLDLFLNECEGMCGV